MTEMSPKETRTKHKVSCHFLMCIRVFAINFSTLLEEAISKGLFISRFDSAFHLC